ncbi:CobW family GTP-binding protein [Heliophilum fasciatum]|uniref:G3E family GTPase n=1 Tax=Heliophilum fasciatum TaxID=35700 RepID=A0A4R2S183_9FIRM|nr:GTP-binding protein [Heliophilum fasciatum]MCW2276662.1 G3E family GTPase [Heliophilum fasciatum]TCP68957.1 G3E family GTPase [Heliophilum fasciatum]
MSIKVDIISGFLGAGKTTLLSKLLKESLTGEKVVIIENEFGEIGIDGHVLREQKIEVLEINSGCICCSLVGDFIRGIDEIVTAYKPERIIIEPTGLARLTDVIKACQKAAGKNDLTLNALITVVDVVHHQAYIEDFGEFYHDQIAHAKTILLSKTQEVDDPVIDSVVASVSEINRYANLITADWAVLTGDEILAIAELSPELDGAVPKAFHDHSHCDDHEAAGQKIIDIWGAETERSFSAAEIKANLNVLPHNDIFGTILRGKGLIRAGQDGWLQFDYVRGFYRIKEAGTHQKSRLCFIGYNVNKKALNELFGTIC